jgi:hypothetical protein
MVTVVVRVTLPLLIVAELRAALAPSAVVSSPSVIELTRLATSSASTVALPVGRAKPTVTTVLPEARLIVMNAAGTL